MTAQEITDQLQRIAAADDFDAASAPLADAWSSAGAGLETVEPILRFMEEHPTIDFGMPGPLVPFVERFYRKGYEEKLIESIQRRPTAQTVLMLNRLINGAEAPDARQRLIATMERARLNPQVDDLALEKMDRFLERLSHQPS
jgi:hypothetical protein